MNKVYRCRQGQQTEKEIYLYFVRYFRKHGYSPSYEEIGEALNISRRTVQTHATSLMDRGLLATDHPGCVRAVRLTGYEFRPKRARREGEE